MITVAGARSSTEPRAVWLHLQARKEDKLTGYKCIRQGMWAPALRKAGVRYRNPYQTRHTYASMMLMAGEHVMWVAKQMGHTNWSLTAERYSRWITSDMPDAGQKAVRLWSQLGHNASATDSEESGEGGIRTHEPHHRYTTWHENVAS